MYIQRSAFKMLIKSYNVIFWDIFPMFKVYYVDLPVYLMSYTVYDFPVYLFVSVLR